MRVLFVLHGPYDCNSGVQVFHFANELARLGHEPSVCAPGSPERVVNVGEPRFELLSQRDLRRNGSGFDVVHTWTPREGVRKLTERASTRSGAPYLVHLEDNEELILSAHLHRSYDEIKRLPPRLLDRRTEDGAVHPHRYPPFVDGAAAVTVITSALSRFAGESPWTLLRPGVDAARFAPEGETVDRSSLGISEEEFVVVYPGNLHSANKRDMLSLFLAAALLRRRGHPVRLVRLGSDFLPDPDPSFAAVRAEAVELESVPWQEVPRYLRMADALIQPGAPNDFNTYRLPAKLPEFLATGKPVLMPDCNLAEALTDDVNAVLLERGVASEIADRLEPLIADPERARRIGAAGREFALAELDWERAGRRLASLYEEVA